MAEQEVPWVILLLEKSQATDQGKVLAGKLKMEFTERPPPKPHTRFDVYNFDKFVCTLKAYRGEKFIQVWTACLA